MQGKDGPSQTTLKPNTQIYKPESELDSFNASDADSMNEQYAYTSRSMFRPATDVQTHPSDIIVEHVQMYQVSRSTIRNFINRLPKLPNLPHFNEDIQKL